MSEQLQTLLGASTISSLIEMGAFEALWAKDVSSFKQLNERLSKSCATSLGELVGKEEAGRYYKMAVDRLHSKGVHHFGIKVDGTVDYPEKLHDAEHPLKLLYYRGDWGLVFTRGIAVVGTRNPTVEGTKRARRLVKSLVEAGFTIYSGLAAGIDTAAHLSAIENGGRTVAVIGTPLWHHYPRDNALLQEKIAKEHLLISQVPIVSYEEHGIVFNRIFFPERNKTMSALSEATVIVEAGETSGTLIQARAALKQGRKVFILNNNFENAKLKWPHRFEAKGALRVRDVEDILRALK